MDRQKLIEGCRDFAAAKIATRPELHQTRDFPADLWRALGESGLMGLGLPGEHGGTDCSYAELARAAHVLTRTGGNKGVTMTWLAHIMNARLHLAGSGSEAQKSRWLPALARGETTLCIAISEPGAGAHPKHLKTWARRDGDDYLISGEKTYLTNGPLAGLFIVLAITGEEAGRKQFSGFLVPRESPGLRQVPGVEIDFLHPAPHCGIVLENCRLPAANLLGPEGDAFERISLNMRALEDALATASTAGALAYELGCLARAAADNNDRELIAGLGQMSTLAAALDQLAFDLAARLDRPAVDTDSLNRLSDGFRQIARHLQKQMDGFIKAHQIVPGTGYDAMRHDIVKSQGIARSAHQAKSVKYGQAFIAESTNS